MQADTAVQYYTELRVLLQFVASELCLRVRKAEYLAAQLSVNTHGLDKTLKVISLNNSACTMKSYAGQQR